MMDGMRYADDAVDIVGGGHMLIFRCTISLPTL